MAIISATQNKPWYASITILIGGGFSLAAAGYAGYMSFKTGDYSTAVAAVLALAGSIGAIVGRFNATGPIGKALSWVDLVTSPGVIAAITQELQASGILNAQSVAKEKQLEASSPTAPIGTLVGSIANSVNPG